MLSQIAEWVGGNGVLPPSEAKMAIDVRHTLPAVSYTHLDVYKRQAQEAYCCTVPNVYNIMQTKINYY